MRKLIASFAAAALVAGGLAAPAAAQQRPARSAEQQQRAPRAAEQRPARNNTQQQQPRPRTQRPADETRGDQASARQEMQAGRTMPSREIERRIVPQMKGSDYLGFEYDSDASAYRLKFIREGHVTWVDVDARTGRVLRISK